jgi:hypothetical protein
MVMNAARREGEWKYTDEQRAWPGAVTAVLTRGYTPAVISAPSQQAAAATQSCPHCGSVIYSRRNRVCGVCNGALPQELLFNPIQAGRVERLLASERARHRRWMDRLSATR